MSVLASEDYVRHLRGRFEEAAAVAGIGEADLEIAGMRLRLRFAGESVRTAILPPFEHLLAAAAEPELTICVFDAAASGVGAPRPVWDAPPPIEGGNPAVLLRSDHACVVAAAGTGAITAVEAERGRALFHLPDAGAIAPAERAAPLREALQLLMAPRGRWMTHAGAVGRDGLGVLLVGRGGSGKSTLALSCALAGMEIAADDYVLLEADGTLAHAMQSTAKLTRDSAERLRIGAQAIDPAGFEPTLEGPAKALVDIRALTPGRMRSRLRIGAVVAPQLTGLDAPRLQRVSAAAGLRALAPSTILQSLSRDAAPLAALAGLTRRVPSYQLELSPEPAANAAAVDRLVGELG